MNENRAPEVQVQIATAVVTDEDRTEMYRQPKQPTGMQQLRALLEDDAVCPVSESELEEDPIFPDEQSQELVAKDELHRSDSGVSSVSIPLLRFRSTRSTGSRAAAAPSACTRVGHHHNQSVSTVSVYASAHSRQPSRDSTSASQASHVDTTVSPPTPPQDYYAAPSSQPAEEPTIQEPSEKPQPSDFELFLQRADEEDRLRLEKIRRGLGLSNWHYTPPLNPFYTTNFAQPAPPQQLAEINESDAEDMVVLHSTTSTGGVGSRSSRVASAKGGSKSVATKHDSAQYQLPHRRSNSGNVTGVKPGSWANNSSTTAAALGNDSTDPKADGLVQRARTADDAQAWATEMPSAPARPLPLGRRRSYEVGDDVGGGGGTGGAPRVMGERQISRSRLLSKQKKLAKRIVEYIRPTMPAETGTKLRALKKSKSQRLLREYGF